MVGLDKIFTMLVNSVHKDKASIFLKSCKNIGMMEIDYFDTGMDNNLPEFDKGYNLIFTTNDDIEARLELLEKDSIVMQAGIQIVYPFSLFSSCPRRHFKALTDYSNSYYGESLPMDYNGTKILNYGNISSVAYVSKGKLNGRNFLNFKVGNRRFW